MRLLLPAALLALSVGLTACTSATEPRRDESGAVESEGKIGAFTVKLGDCLKEPVVGDEGLEQVDEVAAVPCSEPHESEVYFRFDLPDGDFPGDDAVSKAADERCIAEFAPFVGKPFEESALEFFTFQPTESSWSGQDDREVLCIVGDPNAASTGTLKGAAR